MGIEESILGNFGDIHVPELGPSVFVEKDVGRLSLSNVIL